jgi:hypothetical protein
MMILTETPKVHEHFGVSVSDGKLGIIKYLYLLLYQQI